MYQYILHVVISYKLARWKCGSFLWACATEHVVASSTQVHMQICSLSSELMHVLHVLAYLYTRNNTTKTMTTMMMITKSTVTTEPAIAGPGFVAKKINKMQNTLHSIVLSLLTCCYYCSIVTRGELFILSFRAYTLLLITETTRSLEKE